MPSSGARDNGHYGDDAAVFEEVTPAARTLIERLINHVDQAKQVVEQLNHTISVLQSSSPQVEPKPRTGHGSILYDTGDQLLADVDRELLKTPLWADLPSVDVICGGLPGMKSTGMAKSTLRSNLIKFELMPKGMKLKRWLLDRKLVLDEQRGHKPPQPHLFSHLAATFIVVAGCLGKFDPIHNLRLFG